MGLVCASINKKGPECVSKRKVLSLKTGHIKQDIVDLELPKTSIKQLRNSSVCAIKKTESKNND